MTMIAKEHSQAEALRKIFVAITQNAIQKYPASQYFWDNGTEARHGFVCGGFHLWLDVDSRGETYFKMGPVPTKKLMLTEYLILGSGTLPYDEVKAGMVTPKRLQFYWDMLEKNNGWFDNIQGWSEPLWWYRAPGLSIFQSAAHAIQVVIHGNIDQAEGEALYFNIPDGGIIPPCKVALVDSTEYGTPPVALIKGTGEGFNALKGCIAAGHITKAETSESFVIKSAARSFLVKRIGGKFTVKQTNNKQEEQMRVNLSKPSIDDLPSVEKTEEAPVTEPLTTNPPVEPVAVEKEPENVQLPPPAAPVQDDVPVCTGEAPVEVLTLKEKLERAFEHAETLKVLATEFLKELKPLIKEVAKLEKEATDGAEVKELRTENKSLSAENARLKNAMKLLVNGDKF